MSHPLLSRAEIEALLGEKAISSAGEGVNPATSPGVQEAGTGVAAWHELVSLLWSNVASTLSSAARPVSSRIREERLLDQTVLAAAAAGQPLAGMDGNALTFPIQCSPDWLSSWVVLPFAAVASLEELAGGEWGGAAHPYPTALAALVAREIRSGLTGILGPEVTVTPGPQAVALSDLLRTALKDGRWLGLSLELTWTSTLVPVLHLFSAEVPVRLYQRLVHHEAAAAAAIAVPPAEAKPAGSSAQAGPHRGIGSGSRTLGPFPLQSSVWAGGATVSGGERPVVKPVELPSFGDRQQQVAVEADNTQLLLDVPMRVSIELGHARLSMRDILSLGRGSTIELDRLVGEPVDVLVNGRLIAKGEVVLVDEAFGVRIIAIVPPGERLREEMSATGS